MTNHDCISFLQWALPRLRMRWSGFRKVRGQVCKRVTARIRELDFADPAAYQSHLEQHPDEWLVLDSLCRVTISRFYRDQEVFRFLENEVLPLLARDAVGRGEQVLKCWSIGCAAGEEPYSLALMWHFLLQPRLPEVRLQVLASDDNRHVLQRARDGCYPASSLRELPREWVERAFVLREGNYRLHDELRAGVTFLEQDIRSTAPAGPFHLILCRNAVFTYFGLDLQQECLVRIGERLALGGALVIGKHETLPGRFSGWTAWSRKLGVYRMGQ